MHLTLIISSLNAGGAERVLSDLANYWVSKEHQVTLVTLNSPHTKPFYSLDSNIHLVQLNQSQNESSFLKRLWNIFRRIFCLRITLKTLNPDVVISFVDMMNLTTLLASTGLKFPVIVAERTHPAYHKLPLLYQQLRAIFYPKAYRTVVQTQSATDYFKNLRNLAVIPNAVKEPSLKKTTVLDKAQHIISVGRLCPVKGFDNLIYAFARLHSHYPNLRLTIYGEGAERDNLQTLINSLKLQEKVLLPGVIQDIHQKLAAADLFVLPSLYEGFPNALCEAMSVGLPVIASNCSGNIDIVRDSTNGRLFPVGDVIKLTALIEELINDSDQRKRLGEEAQTISEKFQPKHVFHLWDKAVYEATGQNS